MIKHFIFGLSAFFSLPVFAQMFPQPTDCRMKIASLVCLVDPTSGNVSAYDRPCLPESPNYASVFEAHFDRSPAVLRAMYCHLNKIFIEKVLPATAYAGQITDKTGKAIGGVLGIRQEILDHPMQYGRWLSWKEETTFGGSPVMTDPNMGLIQYISNIDTPDMMIDFVLAHEFGHLFDFANTLNKLDDCHWKEDENGEHHEGACTPSSGSWGALSWANIEDPLPQNDYPLRKETCFYFCKGNYISPNDSVKLFNGLVTTAFVSTYAAWTMAEDFAETFAYALMTKERGLTLMMETHGVYFDLTGHFHSDLLTEKRAYVDRFLNGPYMYPGENAAPTEKKFIQDR